MLVGGPSCLQEQVQRSIDQVTSTFSEWKKAAKPDKSPAARRARNGSELQNRITEPDTPYAHVFWDAHTIA
jgi:hypothetical protein